MVAETPQRIKFTNQPPDLCEDCYWRHRFFEAAGQNKRLRRELLEKRAGKLAAAGKLKGPTIKRQAKETEEDEPRQREESRDYEVQDVVEQIRRMTGEE